MSPKKTIVIVASIAIAAAAAISIDYFLFKKASYIKCEISPISELPTAASLLIRIEPESYLSRFSSQPRILANHWVAEYEHWSMHTPSAFFYAQSPLPQLANAQGGVVIEGALDTGFNYKWSTWLVKNTPDTNHIQVPTKDGHVYTFNSAEVTVSREDGSYTEVIADSRVGRNPRDEVTVHGKCAKVAEPPKKPKETVL